MSTKMKTDSFIDLLPHILTGYNPLTICIVDSKVNRAGLRDLIKTIFDCDIYHH